MPAHGRIAVTALALAAVAPLAACGGDGDEPASTTASTTSTSSTPATQAGETKAGETKAAASTTVKRDELEKDMLNKLNQNGSSIASVECPDTVQATAGAKTTCKVKAKDGQTKDYEVTVTSVNGTDVAYSANPK